MPASATLRDRLPSAAAAIALQGGLLALLVLSFEVVRHVAPEKETFINLPPLARQAQRAPVVIDARQKPQPGGGTTAAPPLSLPAYATPSFSLGMPQGATALQNLNRDLSGCGIDAPGKRDPQARVPCPPATALARPDPNTITLTDKPVKNAPIWQAEVERRNAPVGLPGASGGLIGLLGTLLFNPGAYGDKRSYSYAPPADSGKIDGAEATHQAWSQIPQCAAGLDDTSRKYCQMNVAAAPLLRLGGSVAAPVQHISDSAFQQALAATQARTRALYGRPVLASAPKTEDGDAKNPVSGNSGAAAGGTGPGR